MNIAQQKLVNAYATLVLAKEITLKEVPATKLIGGIEYQIKSEVENEIARRTTQSL